MKLLSIRLHPFGGTANRTCTLHDGINVLEGPNEFGKSTLSNALWHALFTSTHLTPAALRNTMGRWYPKPGGDHVRVTLEFEANGQIWTLQKTWGAGAASSLQADGAASIADPAKVQAQLATLLRRNEATWRHVLFTRSNSPTLSRNCGTAPGKSTMSKACSPARPPFPATSHRTDSPPPSMPASPSTSGAGTFSRMGRKVAVASRIHGQMEWGCCSLPGMR